MPGDLRDYAEEPNDFVLASDLTDADEFELQNLATLDADEIPGEFPKYGTFIECLNGEPSTVWVECPRGLAAVLVDHGVEPGDTFDVIQATKGESGAWEFEIDT